MNKPITVFVSGHFNILHPGHLRLLRAAKDYGSRLIVAVESDRLAGNTAHLPEKLRLEGVQSHALVDEAFIADEPIVNIIGKLRPDVVVKGKEHELRTNLELGALNSYGGRLVFSSGESFFSSIDLIRKEFQIQDYQSIKLPMDYLRRHNIKKINLIKFLNEFKKLKICVVGDLIIDEYITCEPLGMSQEDPTIVVMPVDSTRFIGGAGIVAAHAAGLGSSVQFVSVTGLDNSRDFAMETLAAAGVKANLILDETRPTTLKQRYRSKGKSLLRVSHLHQGSISAELQKKILEAVKLAIENADLLVFSDFNYGCLPQKLVLQIVKMAKDRGVLLAADSQSSSQIGNVSRFENMDLITPTEREARISTRNNEDGLVVLAEQIQKQSKAKNVLLKLGEEGLLIHSGAIDGDDWLTDRIPGLNSAAKDVAGAGDSMLIASSMTLACKGTIWEAAFMGSLAAAVQVGRVGNTPLLNSELLRELIS
jgi:rfaE bifunctional protein kinase chain/domain